MAKKTSRNFTFTIHKTTPKVLKDLDKVSSQLEHHSFIVYSLETAPTTGKKHIQGYIQLTNSRNYEWLWNYFNLSFNRSLVKFHVEPARGSADDNITYISKETNPTMYGTPKKPGERTDLLQVREHLKQNPKDLKRMILNDVSNYQAMKYAENLQKYLFEHRDPKNPPVVYWIYGSAGTGKTKVVYDSFDDICNVSDFHWLGTGYTQNECFLLDDFRESDMSFQKLLKIIDRYPYTMPVKGSSVPLNSPYIIITSPKSVANTFTQTEEELQQIHRRLIEIDISINQNIDLKNVKNINTQPDINSLDFDNID